nr:hypothetical protein HAGR004_00120 [Bdellovibrio sp. HAGR004]
MSKALTEDFFRLESFFGPWYLWCMKQFENRWIYEFFEEKSDAIIKSMFGGLALYYQGQLKLVIMEDAGNDLYRGKKYPYDIWNGLLICTSREQHPALQAQFPSLVLHPVLPKWLYVPFTSESWESLADSIIKLVRSGDPRIGVWPQQKKKKKVSRKKVSKKISTSRKTKRK